MNMFDWAYRSIRISMVVALIFFLPTLSHAQLRQTDSCQSGDQVDMKDVIHRLSHKTPQAAGSNAAANGVSKPAKAIQLAVLPAVGYSSNTGLAAAACANAVFTLPGASKESSVLTSITYTQYRQTILPFLVSIWSKNDRFNFVFDDRYINYPSSLYGVLGRSKIDSGYTVNFSWVKLHQSVLARIRPNMYLGMGLYYDYYWNIKEENVPTVLPPRNARLGLRSAFEDYTGQKIPADEETAVGPVFKFLFDSRDNPINPEKGIYGSVIYHPSFKTWGSDANCATLIVDARKYLSLSANKYNVLAFWAYYWANFGNAPFLMLPSSGWDDLWNTGRGYSQGRYRGNQMRYFESEYRFQLSRNGLLGGVLFTNIQNFPGEMFTSYSNYHDLSQANVTELGYGMGLRLKLNKCSKTNLAFDAGFGQSFPRPWFAINLGEVF